MTPNPSGNRSFYSVVTRTGGQALVASPQEPTFPMLARIAAELDAAEPGWDRTTDGGLVRFLRALRDCHGAEPVSAARVFDLDSRAEAGPDPLTARVVALATEATDSGKAS